VQQYLAVQGISAPANLGFSGLWNSATIADGIHRLSIRVADAAEPPVRPWWRSPASLCRPPTESPHLTIHHHDNRRVDFDDHPSGDNHYGADHNHSTVPTTTASTTTTTAPRPPHPPRRHPGCQRCGIWMSHQRAVSYRIPCGAGWSFINRGGVAELPARVDVLIDGVFATQAALGIAAPMSSTHFACGHVCAAEYRIQFAWNSINATPGNQSSRSGSPIEAAAFGSVVRVDPHQHNGLSACRHLGEDRHAGFRKGPSGGLGGGRHIGYGGS